MYNRLHPSTCFPPFAYRPIFVGSSGNLYSGAARLCTPIRKKRKQNLRGALANPVGIHQQRRRLIGGIRSSLPNFTVRNCHLIHLKLSNGLGLLISFRRGD